MLVALGLELNIEGRALAWALDYPGCFAYGADGPEAVIAMARELVSYEEWVNGHAEEERLKLGDFDLRLVDTWNTYDINERYDEVDEGYEVNAWFRHDWKPLQAEQIQSGLNLLRWSREDLLQVAAAVRAEQMDRKRPGERWSIRGILRHVANAEWWYLDRLGLAEGPRGDLPAEVSERLQVVRQRLTAVLPEMIGQERVIGKEGEIWSPRKLLRRALWHEIDHTRHILKLLRADMADKG